MLIKKEGDDEIPADRRSAASPHQGVGEFGWWNNVVDELSRYL